MESGQAKWTVFIKRKTNLKPHAEKQNTAVQWSPTVSGRMVQQENSQGVCHKLVGKLSQSFG